MLGLLFATAHILIMGNSLNIYLSIFRYCKNLTVELLEYCRTDFAVTNFLQCINVP